MSNLERLRKKEAGQTGQTAAYTAGSNAYAAGSNLRRLWELPAGSAPYRSTSYVMDDALNASARSGRTVTPVTPVSVPSTPMSTSTQSSVTGAANVRTSAAGIGTSVAADRAAAYRAAHPGGRTADVQAVGLAAVKKPDTVQPQAVTNRGISPASALASASNAMTRFGTDMANAETGWIYGTLLKMEQGSAYGLGTSGGQMGRGVSYDPGQVPDRERQNYAFLTSREKQHAASLSGQDLGAYIRSLDLDSRRRAALAEENARIAADYEAGESGGSAALGASRAADDPTGRMIAYRVTGERRYAGDMVSGSEYSVPGVGAELYRNLSDTQKNTIRRLADAGDFAGVKSYWDSIQSGVYALNREEETRANEEFGEKHPVLSMPTQFALGMLGAPSALGKTISGNIRNWSSGKYRDIDPNDPAFSLSAAATAQGEGASRALEEHPVLNTMRGGTISAAQNLLLLYLGGGPAAKGAQAFVLGGMALNAAGQTSYQSLREGKTADRALVDALVDAGIETGTESINMERWFKVLNEFDPKYLGSSLKQIARQLPAQMIVEGMEEVLGNEAGQIWDTLSEGDRSEYAKRIETLVSQGLSRTEAEQEAALELHVYRDAQAFAEAAFSVLLMDGAPASLSAVQQRAGFADDGRRLREDGGVEAVNRTIQKGMIFPENTSTRQSAEKLAEKWQDGKGTISNRALGRQAFLNANALAGLAETIEERGDPAGIMALQTVFDSLGENLNDKVAVEDLRTLMGYAYSETPTLREYLAAHPVETDSSKITGMAELTERLRSWEQAVNLDRDGQPLVGYAEAARRIQERFPDASPADVRQMVRQYRDENRTILFGGQRLTKAQFADILRVADPDLTDAQATALFRQAALDTLDGSDAFDRYMGQNAPGQENTAQNAVQKQENTALPPVQENTPGQRLETEDDLPFYFGEDEQRTAPGQAAEAEDDLPFYFGEDEQRTAPGQAAEAEDFQPGIDYEDRVTAEAVRTLDAATQDQIDNLVTLLGKRLRFANSVEGGIANGQIVGNDIVLDRALLESEKPEALKRKILGHELTHGLETDAPEEYARFRAAVLADPSARERMEQIRAAYELHQIPIDQDRIEQEVVADYGGDILGDTDAAQQFIARNRQDRGLLTRIRDAIVRLIRKLSGAEKRQLQTVRGLYDAALDAAAKNVRENGVATQNETAATQDGGVRFSLKQFVDGRRFVDIQTDQTQFDGLTDKEKTSIAIQLIKKRFAGKVIGLDNRVFVNGRTAAEYGHPVKNIDSDVRNAKMRASTELDNLVDAGENHRTAPDGADGHVHSNSTGAFEYYDTIFKVGDEYYQGIVNIQTVARGKLLKDVTKIKNITQDISSSYGQNPKSTFLRDASMGTLPYSPSKVKPQNSLKGTEDAETARRIQELMNRNRALEQQVKAAERKWRAEKAPAQARKNVVIGEVNTFAKDFLKAWSAEGELQRLRPAILRLMNSIKAGPEGGVSANVTTEAENAWIADMEDQGREIARQIVESAIEEEENPEREALEEFRAELKTSRISYEDARARFTDPKEFNRWRLRNQLRMGLRKDGRSVDSYWNDWGQRFGTTFFPEDITTPEDMLFHIEELLDNTETMWANPFEQYDALEVVEDCKNALINEAQEFLLRDRDALPLSDREAVRDAAYQRGVRDERKRNADREKRIADHITKLRQTVMTERERGDERLRQYKEKLRERRKEQAAAEAEDWTRTQITRLMKRLNNRKMRQADRAVLNSIYHHLNDIAQNHVGMTAQDVYNNRLLLWDRIDEKSENYDEAFIRNPTVQTLSGTVEGRDLLNQRKRSPTAMKALEEQTTNMTVEELARVGEFLQAFLYAQQTIDTMIQARNRADLNVQADQVIAQAKAAQPFALGGIVTHMLRPNSFARRVSGFAEQSALQDAFRDMSEGERTRDGYKQRAENALLNRFARNLGLTGPGMNLDAKGRKAAVEQIQKILRSFGGKEGAAENQLIAVDGVNAVAGGSVRGFITRGMRAALYLHRRNADNMRHIKQGGITVPSKEGYERDYRKGQYQKAYTKDAVRIRLTEAQVDSILNGMTAEERAFAEACAWYLDSMSKPELSRVHEALKGWSPFYIENYMPIETDKMFNNRNFIAGELNTDGSMGGLGFTKERVKAGNPILLRDLQFTVTDAIENHARFVGLAIPTRNMNKLLNRNRVTASETEVLSAAFGEEDAGRIDRKAREYMKAGESRGSAYRIAAEELMGQAGVDAMDEAYKETAQYSSVRAELNTLFGDPVTDYLEKLMQDMTMPQKPDSPLRAAAYRLTGNLAQATLTLSGTVAPVQAASYPTAAAVIGWAPLVKALKDLPSTVAGKADLRLINAYTSRLWERSQGFSTHEAQTLRGEKGGLPNALNWIQGMDVGTTTLLWKACEYYVAKAQPDLAKDRGSRKEILNGESAFYQAVADVYNRVIEETQPSYGTMERPQILRDQSDIIRLTNQFKTQMYQNFNILYDALGELGTRQRTHAAEKSGQSKAALDAARRKAGSAATALLVAQAMAAIIKAAFNIWIGNDDKYRDKEGELTAASVGKGVALGTVGAFPGMVAYGSEIYSGMAGLTDTVLKKAGYDPFFNETFYGVNFQLAETIKNTYSHTKSAAGEIAASAREVLHALEDEENAKPVNWQALASKILKVGEDAAALKGIPARNIGRILWGFARSGAMLRWGPTMGEYVLLHLTSSPELERNPYYDLLLKAGGNRLYSSPDGKNVPEAYRTLYAQMLKDGFSPDDIQEGLKSRLGKNSAFQRTRSEYAAHLSTQVQALRGYSKLTESEKEKLKDNISTAARYTTLMQYSDHYTAVNQEKWVEKCVEFGETYRISIAPLTMLHAAVSGIKGIPGADGKTIDNSESLKKMERIYALWPDVDGWTQEKRVALFSLFDVGQKVSSLSKDGVADRLSRIS